MNTGVYEIRNTVNGKRYIGSAVSFHARWTKHLSLLRRGVHHASHLQRSWDKHGSDAFEFRKILICDKSNLIMYEQIAFEAFKPEFNVLPKAGSCLGVKRSPEFAAAVSARKKGQTHSEQTKKQISDRLKELGIYPRLSVETRARISAERKGKVTPHLQRLKEMKIGVPRTDEVRIKLSKAGARLTDEQVRQIRSRYRQGEMQKHLGAEVGIRQSCVSEIVRGVTYAWVN